MIPLRYVFFRVVICRFQTSTSSPTRVPSRIRKEGGLLVYPQLVGSSNRNGQLHGWRHRQRDPSSEREACSVLSSHSLGESMTTRWSSSQATMEVQSTTPNAPCVQIMQGPSTIPSEVESTLFMRVASTSMECWLENSWRAMLGMLFFSFLLFRKPYSGHMHTSDFLPTILQAIGLNVVRYTQLVRFHS